jgi:hypothetical protein
MLLTHQHPLSTPTITSCKIWRADGVILPRIAVPERTERGPEIR